MTENEATIQWGQEPHHCADSHSLDVHDLHVHYGPVCALHHIEFSCACGHSLALLGCNGAGKSTLLKAIAGLVPVGQGEVRWKGQAVRKHTYEISYLPQREAVDWNFPITVRGLVEMGRYPQLGIWRRYRTRDEEVVNKALAAMQLENLAERQISALSGGQQQRAFIARALAQEAHVLLLDEPFTGLDQPSQEVLNELLQQLTAEGRLVIASHHDLKTVAHNFDRALLLNRNQVGFGPVEEVMTDELLDQAFAR